MNLTNSLIRFAEENKCTDLFEAWDDLCRQYRTEVEGKNFTYLPGTIAEKNKIIHESINDMIKERIGGPTFTATAWMNSTAYKETAFEIVNALIDAQLPATVEQTFGRFADVRVGGFGDNFVFDVAPGDLFVVTKVGNGRRHAFGQRQYNGQVKLDAEARMITVEEDLYRILANKRNLAEYAMKVMRSFETEVTIDIYNAVNDTFASLPTQFKESSFAQDTFLQLANRIQAFNGGASVSVFGTKLALSKVVPTSDYMKMAIGAEYVSTGYVGRFMGVDLFEIPPVAVWDSTTYATAVDDTRLYLISSSAQKLVKVCYEGDTMTYSDMVYQNADLLQRNTTVKRWIVGLASASYFGIIDVG